MIVKKLFPKRHPGGFSASETDGMIENRSRQLSRRVRAAGPRLVLPVLAGFTAAAARAWYAGHSILIEPLPGFPLP
jgi:hypothetical protein